MAIGVAVLASVVFLPGGMTRWFLPKDALFALAAVGASLSLGRGRLPRWLLVCAGAGILLLLVGVAFSASPAASFWGRWPRYEGAVGLSAYLIAVWAGARLLGPAAGLGRLRAFLGALSVASILLGVVGVLESFGIDPIPTPWERPGSLAGNASDQGILGLVFAAVLVLPAVHAWRRAGIGTGRVRARGDAGSVVGAGGGGDDPLGESRWRGPWFAGLLGLGAAFGVVTVVVSASRAAFLGAVVVVLVLAALQVAGLVRARPAGERDAASRRRVRRGVLGAVGGLVLLVGVALAVPLTRNRLLGLSPLSMSTVSDRFLIYRDALALIGGRPLTGVGPSGFVDAVPGVQDALWYEAVGTGTVLDSPHNLLLQAALAGGVPLALLLALTGVLVLIVGVRRWAEARAATAAPGPPTAGRSAAAAGSSGVAAEPPGARGPLASAHDAGRADSVREAQALRPLMLAGSLAALAGTAAALATSFTVPATALISCLLIGLLVARAPRGGSAASGDPASSDTGDGQGGMAGGRVPARRRRVVARVRTGVLAVWAVGLVVAAGAELSLQAGLERAEAGDVSGAEAAFGVAQALRPWDADVAVIAAQTFAAAAAAADAGGEADFATYRGVGIAPVFGLVVGGVTPEDDAEDSYSVPGMRTGAAPDAELAAPAAERAEVWAGRASAALPTSVPALKALAVAQQVRGDRPGLAETLERLVAAAPADPDVRAALELLRVT